MLHASPRRGARKAPWRPRARRAPPRRTSPHVCVSPGQADENCRATTTSRCGASEAAKADVCSSPPCRPRALQPRFPVASPRDIVSVPPPIASTALYSPCLAPARRPPPTAANAQCSSCLRLPAEQLPPQPQPLTATKVSPVLSCVCAPAPRPRPRWPARHQPQPARTRAAQHSRRGHSRRSCNRALPPQHSHTL